MNPKFPCPTEVCPATTVMSSIIPGLACLCNMLKPCCADVCCLANQCATSGFGLILLFYPATGPTMDPAFLELASLASLASLAK